MTKKRHQHYVWRYYLNAWAENEQIYCLRNKKIFKTNLMGIAQERDFYRLKELNEQDIFLINKLLIEQSPEFIRKEHEILLKIFLAPYELIKKLRKEKKMTPELEDILDEAVNNFEENLHAMIESQAIPYLDKLRKKDGMFLQDDDNCIEFFHYLAVQYHRTSKRKAAIIDTFKKIPLQYVDMAATFNIEKIWNIMSHILSTNVAWSLFINRLKYKLILIENETQIPFITSDQPLINSAAVGGLEPKTLDIYYPISPTVAIYLTENAVISTSNIVVNNMNEIDGYNKAIIGQAKEQLYANSKEVLERYVDVG